MSVAYAPQRTPASTAENDFDSAAQESMWTGRSSFASSRPVSAGSERRPSLSAAVTSAISDEEDSEADNGDDERHSTEQYSDFEDDDCNAKKRTPVASAQRAARDRTSGRSSAQQRGAGAHGTASGRKSNTAEADAAPVLSFGALARTASSEAVVLSGPQWRQRLHSARQEVIERRYSRGERLIVDADSLFIDSDDGSADGHGAADPLRPGTGARPRSAMGGSAQLPTAQHRSMTGGDLPALSPFEAVPSGRFSATFDAAAQSTTARSTASSASFALKHAAYAKDREGMEQERRELQRIKRGLLRAISDHERHAGAVQAEHEAVDAALLALARQKGMARVGHGSGSRFERRAVTDDGRVNPQLSLGQVLRALQREIAALEREKEDKERAQDAAEERESQAEQQTALEDADDGRGAQQSAVSQRRRLLALREKKRALLEKVHAMQDRLMETRRRPPGLAPADDTSAALTQLEQSLTRARAHKREYTEQRRRAAERLDSVRRSNARLYEQLQENRGVTKSTRSDRR